jgi:WD40 repeat protein
MQQLMRFSADGRFLAALDASGKVSVWEVAPRQELRATFPTDPSARVSMLAISPGGRFLALGSKGTQTVQLWDVTKGTQLSLPPHEQPVTALGFASANTLLTASEDKTVRLWEMEPVRQTSRMPHPAQIEAMSVSPNGQQLVTTWVGGQSASVWSISDGRELAQLVHQGAVNAVAWSPKEGWLATASADGTACVWGLAGPEVARMQDWGQYSDMAFTPDGQRLVTAARDEPARVWDVATGRRMAQVKDKDGANLIALSLDGKYVATATGSLARVWDIATGKEQSRLRHGDLIHALAFSPDGVTVASASQDGTARIWEAVSGNEIQRVKHEGPVRAVAFSPHGKLLATGGDDETARVWELKEEGEELYRLQHKAVSCQGPPAPDQAPCQQDSLPDTPSAVQLVRFSPDGLSLATATLDAVARLWDTGSGKELMRQTHPALITAMAFTPDGQGLAVAYGEPAMTIWDMSGKPLATLQEDDGISFLQYSRDGKYLLMAGAQGTASLWETSSGKVVARMEGGPDAEAFLLSPDGRRLAMAQRKDQGSNLLYSIHAWQTEDLLQQTCARLRRNLTKQEWNEYLGETEPYQKTCEALP